MSGHQADDLIALTEGGVDLLDRVAPLWLQLRQHHAQLSPLYTSKFNSFDGRRAGLLDKSNAGLLVILAQRRAEDVGYCVSTIGQDATGEIDSLFVEASHRGQGLGHAMMSRALKWFEAQHITSIYLDVVCGNDDARRFYTRYGFRPRHVRMIRNH